GSVDYVLYGSPSTEMQFDASNGGFRLDIYRLDNSFNLTVNGADVSFEEIEFQKQGTSGINVEFVDGTQYEKNTDLVYKMRGTEENPLLRLEIDADGVVSLQGIKESYSSELFDLQLKNGSFTDVPW